MKTKQSSTEDAPMHAEYDFSNAVRGKYHERYQRGTNIVVIEPDVAVASPTVEAVTTAPPRPRHNAAGRGSEPAAVTSPLRS